MVFSGDDEESKSGVSGEQAGVVPLLPLRDIVVFPQMVVPLFVGRAKSIQALEDAMAGSRELMLSAQRQAGQEEPSAEDIYTVGTLGTVIQLLRLPDGTVKVLVEGKSRARIQSFQSNSPYFSVRVESLPDAEVSTPESEGLVRTVHATFESYSKLNKKAPAELLSTISAIDEPGKLADSIVVHLNLKVEERQGLLEMMEPLERLEDVYSRMQAEIEVLEVELEHLANDGFFLPGRDHQCDAFLLFGLEVFDGDVTLVVLPETSNVVIHIDEDVVDPIDEDRPADRIRDRSYDKVCQLGH